MVAIVMGSGLGVERASGLVIGSRGQLGNQNVGRLGTQITVNAETGNIFIQGQDEVLVGRGPDSLLSRSYNSLGLMNDDNGDNWRLNGQRYITLVSGGSGTENTPGSQIKRGDWDGSEIYYTWDSARNAYLAKVGAGSYDTVTYAAGVWTWTDGPTQRVETYDQANSGRITATKDTDGNQLTYSYDTNGRLSRVTTASGEYTDLIWSGNNLQQLSTTAGGNIITRVRYSYDSANRLQQVTIDRTPSNNSITDGDIVFYTYDYDGTSKRVSRISESGSGSFVSFTYDASNRVQTITEAMFSENLRTTSLSYDSTNRRTTVTDPLGKDTVMAYDASGNLISITYPADGTGTAARTARFSYNSNLDVATYTDTAGKVTTYGYDNNGNLLSEQDAAGNMVSRTYGSKNELVTETRYLIPDPDGAGSGTASSPITSRYVYDGKNHLRFVVNPDGRVSEYRYNAVGQQVTNITYTENFYNIAPLSPATPITESAMLTWVAGLGPTSAIQRSDTAYDYRGNVSKITDYSELNTNLLHYTTFEQGTLGWNSLGEPDIIRQGGPVVATNAGTGLKYVQQTFRAIAATNTVDLFSDQVSVTAGAQLAVSAGVGATAGIGTLELRIQYFGVNGWLGQSNPIQSVSGSQNFNTTLSGFLTIPANVVRIRLAVRATADVLPRNSSSLM